MGKESRKVSIVIPTVPGNENLLRRCVDSIINNTKEKEYEIIVVKNNYIGFAKAVNIGLKKASGDVVLLNDDVFVIEGWLRDFRVARDEFDLIGVKGQLMPEHIPFWGVYIKKEIIEKIGYLDEEFIKGDWEDIDYCVRAIDAGFKLGETAHHLIKHPHPSSTWLKFDKDFNKDRRSLTREYFMKKYKGTKWERRIDGRPW